MNNIVKKFGVIAFIVAAIIIITLLSGNSS